MTRFIIIHGIEGHPEENWFPWLKKELEALGHTVDVPRFPNPAHPNLQEWLDFFEPFAKLMTPETIVIGHSLGAPFLLNVLEKHPAKAAFFIAGWTGEAGNAFDPRMASIAQQNFDWQRIKQNCKQFFVFHADNDPYIKIGKAEELARQLDTKVTLVPGAGHFNAAAGYKQFPQLLKLAREVI